jgi:AbrB family looped-hinge helix DNA binding protein
MSKTTTMTSKGQVTIPKDVRDELGLKPFDRVEIVSDGNGGALLRKAGLSLESAAGMFPGIGLSDEELEQAIAVARDEHFAKKPR